MRGWFVTGTDTGVGKTLVSAAISVCRASAGARPHYVKPIQSGAADGDDDAADVRALADVPASTGVTLGPSVAPAVALELAGAEVGLEELVSFVEEVAAGHEGEVVVEGAGGLLVELTSERATCADLAAALGLPAVVVARAGLGTLNHTALTLEVLAARGLELAGVVVSGFPQAPDVATRTNGRELDRLTAGRLLGVVPRLGSVQPAELASAGSWLGPEVGGDWDRERWLASLEG